MQESYVLPRLAPEPLVPVEAESNRYARSGAASLRSALVWAEHCTECAMPACYTDCALYTPRQDLHCRRFYEDLGRTPSAASGAPWLSVRFRKWGRLQAHGVPSLFSPERAELLERADDALGRWLHALPMQHGFRMRLLGWWTRNKPRLLHAARSAETAHATHFVCESHNPGRETIGLILTLREETRPQHVLQRRLELVPGYNLDKIALGDFFDDAAPDAAYFVSLDMEGDAFGAQVSFGHLDFVRDEVAAASEAEEKSNGPKKAKCVIWDLDNTLWDGVLVEHGVDGVKPREHVFEVIRELDRRGIINAIASKNHFELAEEALRKFGMWEYFCFPQISWGPKSEAVRAIQKSMNVGINTFLFVDDQPFERAEVEAVHPEVEILTDEEGARLIDHDRCDVVVTDESRKRRSFYQQQMLREQAAPDSGEDYAAFLRSCEIVLEIEPLVPDLLDRAHELVQRTNQMNFSGHRYSRAQLEVLANDPDKECWVMRCTDRFGDYGIIGFGVVDRPAWCLEDLMFSCRIQSKRIEHHFIAHLAEKARQTGARVLAARYRKTLKNSPSGAVFDDLGFVARGRIEDVRQLELDLEQFEAPETLIEIRESGPDGADKGNTTDGAARTNGAEA